LNRTAELRRFLESMSHVNRSEWERTIDDRKRMELEHSDAIHNLDAQVALGEAVVRGPNKKYYRTTAASTAYIHSWIAEHARGKVFLDYCCGNGYYAIAAAQAGAALSVGIDISPGSLETARSAAARAGLSEDRIRFVQADAEQTGFPDGCIDAVLCSGVLHHLELRSAFSELQRICAPDAAILAAEALKYNPVINLYRRRTPALRTAWETEHILGLREVRLAQTFFELTGLRYWHVLSPMGAWAPYALPFLKALDAVLTRIPGVQLLAWQFTFELKSRTK
jgi:SAM-dependent methyltransferase